MSQSNEEWNDTPHLKWHALCKVSKQFPREFLRNPFFAPILFPFVLLLAWEDPESIIDPPTEDELFGEVEPQ